MSINTSNNSSNDTSNVFLHDLISLNANDLSDTRISFINYLLNAMNNTNINENLAMLPLAGMYNNAQRSNIANLNELLNRTLQEKYIYKKVLSDQGKQQLKEIIYDSKKFDTKECAITQDTFVEGQTIIQLPCSHIFDPESIKTWLKEESSKCPICRYELKSKEIKTDMKLEEDNDANRTNTNSSTTSRSTSTNRTNTNRTTRLPRINEEEEDANNDNDNDNNYNTMFSNMNILYNNYNNRPQVRAQGRRRRRLISQEQFLNRIIDMQNSYTEDRLVQNAIIASLQDLQNTTGNSTQNTAENTAENAEENTISEINFDAMHDDYFDELEDLYD